MGIGDWAAMGNMGNGHEFILSHHSLSQNLYSVSKKYIN